MIDAAEREALRACALDLRQAGDFFGAAQALDALLEAGPDAEAHRELGLLRWQEGQEAEALHHLGRAAELDPTVEATRLREQARRFFAGATATRTAGPLLAVVDYAAQPYNLGDLLIHMVGALMAAEEAGCEGFDWCFISDPNRPPQDPIMASLVSPDNHLFHLLTFLPEIQLLPGLREVHVFTDLAAFEAFAARRGAERPQWPSREALQERRYMFYDVFQRAHRFFERHGRLPELRFSDHLRAWADGFYARHAAGLVPVTVNLRNNPHFHAHRNSNLAAWTALFRHCEGRHPVKFVITCAATEVDEAVRACPNVVFAKDHRTTLIQDLTLIHRAAFHLGSPSGPAALPLFGTQPYYIFNCDMLPHLAAYGEALALTSEGDLRHSFARGPQAYGTVPETPEALLAQFEKIWRFRDWVAARAPEAPGSEAPPSWMV